MNVVRAVSSEGFGRIRFYTEVHRLLNTDLQFRRYFEQETTELPQFYKDLIKADLGPLWNWLPVGAIYHDQKAYLRSVVDSSQKPQPVFSSLDYSIAPVTVKTVG